MPATFLLLAALCASAGGLQSPASEGSSVHIEGLSPHNWDSFFDPLSPDAPQVRLTRMPQNIRSFAEATRAAQEGSRAIGRQMGVQYMPHDFREGLGDGSAEGMKAKVREFFNGMRGSVAGVDGIIDLGLSAVGSASTMDATAAFNQYSMVAERLGAKSLANQFAPLLRSTTPPNPTTMFNMIGNALASLNMPAETVKFYQELGRMVGGAGRAEAQMFHSLRNRTLAALRNRTVGGRPAPTRRRAGLPDYYKSTSNLMIIIYSLPCAAGSTACFALTNEFYFFKSGPGFWSGNYHAGPPGGMSMAIGVATQTPWSMISTPFYFYPNKAVGQEYDLKFQPGAYPMDGAYLPKSVVSGIVKLRESSDCLGTGAATPDDPRMDTCPFAGLVLTGGAPQLFSILEVMPSRSVSSDSLASFYDLLKYGGPVGGAMSGEMLPGWAWAGFYRSQ